MGTIPKSALSLVVALISTVLIAGTILKASVHFIHPPDYGPTWLGILTLGTMFGSLVLSPIIFGLCYRFLSRKS